MVDRGVCDGPLGWEHMHITNNVRLSLVGRETPPRTLAGRHARRYVLAVVQLDFKGPNGEGGEDLDRHRDHLGVGDHPVGLLWWVVGRSVGRLVGRLIGGLVCWLVNWWVGLVG